ncbi:lantibiotic biosynthesis dehydratase-like protein [Nonomuraea fuscirosea]|uniref:Lantibiotic biosynthesis dehydratase-like protein n=1 Tax=Nonomuraea fuscirosea TaxID=1291556 RepID=A0A2T0MR33_9ACTN|nr:lantibiotic dehydratase [Nonomuraea fuscirosea]PRX60667.1 lantibiotic biosynthesis dehydratase-like protein [Nonomuraea fuscirosea]
MIDHDFPLGTDSPAGQDDGRQWIVTPQFMLRVAGMPIDAVAPLTNPRGVRWADALLAAETAMDAAKQVIADALQESIADNDDERQRRRLLTLRRDVFNRRLPKDLASARALAAHLDDQGRAALLGWLDQRAAYDEELRRGAAVVADETGLARAHLRELARDPRLRKGVLLASPSLDRYLPAYLDAGAGPLNKRARRIERSLLEYVYRTACKTSPFSTFTAVALGRFVPGSGSLFPQVDLDVVWRAHARLNVAALARLIDVIVDQLDLRPELTVRLTSGSRADTERVRYVRRIRVVGDDDIPTGADSMRENLFFLRQGTLLQEVMRILGERAEVSFGRLAELLSAADRPNRSPEDVREYLRRLLQLGLLVAPALHLDVHSADPVESFRNGLARLDAPWAQALADRLGGISELVKLYPPADHEARSRLLGIIRAGLEETQRELGAGRPSTPSNLVYEDVSIPGTGAVADPEKWRRSLTPSLCQVARLLPLFDSTVPQRLSLHGFFTARYGVGGRCDDVLRFVHEFHQDYYTYYLKVTSRPSFDEDGVFVPDPNWLRLPEVEAMTRARRELIRRMKLAAASGTDVLLDDEFVDEVSGMVPDHLLDLEPRSFFVQLGDDGGAPFAVVNQTYSGLTLLFSRFMHCFDDAERGGLAAELRDELAKLQPADAVFAEVTGGYDTTNLNLHPAITPYELVCPGDVSFRDESEQIAVDDLSVLHDERTGRLRLYSWRLGREVIPVYLGFIIPPALPQVQRAMLLFSRTIFATIDLWGGTRAHERVTTISSRPRIRVGDLVVSRRRWTVHPGFLPARGAGDGEAESFLAWRRWQREHGLPQRVFASLGAVPLKPGAGTSIPTFKPQYIDFGSVLSLQLLDRMAREGNRLIVLEEMLPDLEQIWLRSAEGRYVAEQTVEITGTTRPLRGH